MIGLVSRFFTFKNVDNLLQPWVPVPVTPIQNNKSVHYMIKSNDLGIVNAKHLPDEILGSTCDALWRSGPEFFCLQVTKQSRDNLLAQQ